MNNNIKEDYCSFELSRLLKDMGFAVPLTKIFYYKDFYTKWTCSDGIIEYDNRDKDEFASISRPSHALAINWIAKNFNYSIEAEYNKESNDWFGIYMPILPNEDSSGFGKFPTRKKAIDEAMLVLLKEIKK